MSPDRRQAIIWTNACLLSIGPLELQWNLNQNAIIFTGENEFEIVHVVYKTEPIYTGLGRGRLSWFLTLKRVQVIQNLPGMMTCNDSN